MGDIEKRVGNARSMRPERKITKVLSPSENEGIQRQYGMRRNTSDYTARTLKYA